MVEKGFCECGCGERTRVAPKTDRAMGWVRGEPIRFVQGHQRRGVRTAADPNPSGLCSCGCGGLVSLSSRLRFRGHCLFLPGHQGRKASADFVVEDRGYESPCWVWQRKVTRKGYGIVGVAEGGERHAHVVVFERERGAVPDGCELHHRCEVRLCVNPEHLEPLTHAEHMAVHAEMRRAAR